MSVKVSRILHAGYVFEKGDTRIAFDPIFENPFSTNCFAFPAVEFDLDLIAKTEFSAVFISHYHDDHCSLESLRILNRSTPIYLYCIYDEIFELIKALGFTNVFALDLNIPVSISDFTIIPRQALDSDVDSLFHIQVEELNILNVVDSWIDPHTLDRLAKMNSWDLVLWPFQTMQELEVLSPRRLLKESVEIPPEWIEQLKILKPKHLIPSSCQFTHESWSWYRNAFFPISYRFFMEQMKVEIPRTNVFKLNPGQSIFIDGASVKSAHPLNFVKPIGNQDVDYSYLPFEDPTPTSEIAKQFEALSFEQTKIVMDFCRSKLIDRYRELPPSSDSYFDKERVWRLSIFDHKGEAQNFCFKLSGNKAELAADDHSNLAVGSKSHLDSKGFFDKAKNSSHKIDWTTEVPIRKLYGALTEGESLTSMYLRINDSVSTDANNIEVGLADVMQDPLIRCLFSDDIGSYQRSQLKKILGKKVSEAFSAAT